MERTGKERAISYSVHRRLWVATYSLVYWQLKLKQSIFLLCDVVFVFRRWTTS